MTAQVKTCGTVSSALNPLYAATSRIAVAGSTEQYTILLPREFQRPPYSRAPSPLSQVAENFFSSNRHAGKAVPPSAPGNGVTYKRRIPVAQVAVRPFPPRLGNPTDRRAGVD